MNPDRLSLRRVLAALAGLAFGAALLVLALRRVDVAEVRTILQAIAPRWILAAWLAYAFSIAVRVVRWRRLLLTVDPAVGPAAVAETLLVGYAVNNILPARLGEVFRADYAKRRLTIGRSGALGSIVAERLLDGIVIAALLWGGLLLIGRTGPDGDPRRILTSIAVAATVVLVLLGAGIAVLARARRFRRRPPAWLAGRLDELLEGIASLRRSPRLPLAALSLLVWAGETTALAAACRATGVALAPDETMVLMGAASLSTLVPTAPAFLGSYQYVFVVAMQMFGRDPSAGLVAATLIQVVFYGTVTVTGLALLIGRATASLRAARRSGPAPGA